MFCRAIRPPAFQIDDNIITLTASTAAALLRDVRTRRARELGAASSDDADAVMAAVGGTLADLAAAEAALEATRQTLDDIRAAVAALEDGTLSSIGVLPDVVACAADAHGFVRRLRQHHPDAALVELHRDALRTLKEAQQALAEGLETAEDRYAKARGLRAVAAKIAFATDLQRALDLGLKRHLADSPNWMGVLVDVGDRPAAELQQRLRALRQREVEAQRQAKLRAKQQLEQNQLRNDLRAVHQSEDPE